MARRSSDGTYIISAGEVGSYTVCPEAWRLQIVEGAQQTDPPTESSARGSELHESWASDLSEAVDLHRTIRLLLLLILLSVLIALLRGVS